MKISDHIYIVGSGYQGFSMTSPFDCTVYLVRTGEEWLLIDAGSGGDSAQIIRNIESAGCPRERLNTILLTHAHIDHSGGAKHLAEAFDARIYALPESADIVSKGDAEKVLLKKGQDLGFLPPDLLFAGHPVQSLQDGSVLTIGDSAIQVIATPGHSDGHCVFLMELDNKKVLFSGDHLFTYGRVSIQAVWDCRLDRYIESIRRVASLDFDALLPAHFSFAMSGGKSHAMKALERINRIQVPGNVM